MCRLMGLRSIPMKAVRVVGVLISLTLVLCGCSISDGTSDIEIGEYIFRVENAKGDLHNICIVYSLVRKDGGDVIPETHFEWLMTEGEAQSASSGVEYQLSNDGKTLWIVEEQSSSQKYENDALYVVKLENLVVGPNSNIGTIEGSWEVSYRMQIDEAYIEILPEKVRLQFPEDKEYFCELLSVQISSMGIHTELMISDSDITKFSEKFTCCLVLNDGTISEMDDGRHSIRSRRWSDLYNAYCEYTFDKQISADDIQAVIVCDQTICVPKDTHVDNLT